MGWIYLTVNSKLIKTRDNYQKKKSRALETHTKIHPPPVGCNSLTNSSNIQSTLEVVEFSIKIRGTNSNSGIILYIFWYTEAE